MFVEGAAAGHHAELISSNGGGVGQASAQIFGSPIESDTDSYAGLGIMTDINEGAAVGEIVFF